MLESYSSIYNLGHRAVEHLLDGEVLVEEKIDGSQFSFGVCEGELQMRSKGAAIHPEEPDRLFKAAAATAKALAPHLTPGWIYRAEYLSKPKHNTLAYNRVPAQHLMVFDVSTGAGGGGYLPYEEKAAEAARLGLEVVPLLRRGHITSVETFRELLGTTSVLGGPPIEGVVVKPAAYDLYALDHKVLMGKYVSEAFKESHRREWRAANPKSGDILVALGGDYTTPARWQKAVQHLLEAGQLEGSPLDIGPLLREVVADVEKEAGEEIRQRLWAWAWPHLRRQVVKGLPEWYKGRLLKKQFEQQQQQQEM